MPYRVKRVGSQYELIRKRDGKKVATTTKKNLRGAIWHREHGK